MVELWSAVKSSVHAIRDPRSTVVGLYGGKTGSLSSCLPSAASPAAVSLQVFSRSTRIATDDRPLALAYMTIYATQHAGSLTDILKHPWVYGTAIFALSIVANGIATCTSFRPLLCRIPYSKAPCSTLSIDSVPHMAKREKARRSLSQHQL